MACSGIALLFDTFKKWIILPRIVLPLVLDIQVGSKKHKCVENFGGEKLFESNYIKR
jgi:hypothetical protein